MSRQKTQWVKGYFRSKAPPRLKHATKKTIEPKAISSTAKRIDDSIQRVRSYKRDGKVVKAYHRKKAK